MNTAIIQSPAWGSEKKGLRFELEREFSALRQGLGFPGELLLRLEHGTLTESDLMHPAVKKMQLIKDSLSELAK